MELTYSLQAGTLISKEYSKEPKRYQSTKLICNWSLQIDKKKKRLLVRSQYKFSTFQLSPAQQIRLHISDWGFSVSVWQQVFSPQSVSHSSRLFVDFLGLCSTAGSREKEETWWKPEEDEMWVLQQDTWRSYVAGREKKKDPTASQKNKEAKTRATNSEKVIQWPRY